jgi:hypothetical protein
MRTVRFVIVAALVVASAAGHGPSQDGKKKDEPKPAPQKKDDPKSAQAKLMAAKLKHAQALLEGLAVNDFKKITNSADELLAISQKAEFSARKTKEYELQTLVFRRALDDINRKAKEKNLDGAALGYVDLTLTCVRCHQYTREAADTTPRP